MDECNVDKKGEKEDEEEVGGEVEGGRHKGDGPGGEA